MSEIGVIMFLITSQNPSFNTRIQSLSDYNEKIMIDRIKDRIWNWLVRNETGGGARSGGSPGQSVSETKEGDARMTQVRQAREKEAKEAEHAVASSIPHQSSESKN